MNKIAMFGGSFNPVHLGHTGLVTRMIEEFSLDKVYVIPTFNTPLKDNTPMLPPTDRLNMCKLAFENSENVEVSDMEILREGKSFTSDTIKSLTLIHPDSELYLIIGADSFMQLELWHEAQYIFSSVTLLTVSRDNIDADMLIERMHFYEDKYKAKVKIVPNPIAPISSTIIRNAIRDNKKYKHLLPVKVSDYIEKYGLYGYDD